MSDWSETDSHSRGHGPAGLVSSQRPKRLSIAVVSVLAVCIGFIALGLILSWHRTLIPIRLEGPVVRMTVTEAGQPGADDWVTVQVGHRQILTGDAALQCFSQGTHVIKSSWSREVNVDGETCTLPLPRQALADSVMPPVILATLLTLVAIRPRQRSEQRT